MKKEEVKNLLRKYQLKVTPVRVAIVECFSKKGHQLLSIDDLVKSLNDQLDKKTDWSTVYRTIKSFEACGLVTSSHIGKKMPHYEFFHARHHHHVICKKCHKVEPLPECQLNKVQKTLEKSGYKNLKHSLEFFGHCPSCDP